MTLKLGIIGSSEGNGHPYSWSAIFNGYNTETMESCGYPVIPRYLEQQTWPDCRIPNAEVVAIWTQDSEQSKHIAKASHIKQVMSDYTDMIGKVDAVLLARDDAQNHLKYAEPFLRAGLPIYIDKPIALSVTALDKLYDLQQYEGQIFTCSALRFSQELILTEADKEDLGQIKQITAFTPKSWSKYAVHIIEPVLNMLPKGDTPIETLSPMVNDDTGSLIVRWQSGIQTNFFALGAGLSPITIRISGTNGYKDLVFTDSFSAFKAALQAFVNGLEQNKVASSKAFNKQVVELLESGL
nr:Gfo/Idh/MocA family oxidoreductase [uncultured Psychrobacter sp.]